MVELAGVRFRVRFLLVGSASGAMVVVELSGLLIVVSASTVVSIASVELGRLLVGLAVHFVIGRTLAGPGRGGGQTGNGGDGLMNAGFDGVNVGGLGRVPQDTVSHVLLVTDSANADEFNLRVGGST